ncbi:tetratricopeptide repeat-containing protein [Pseudoalteromonas citrea]|uniref:Tetratricopeptide repeat-containing protein n=1 Tax=Pseudoalteromonas citrea TaxID=43655 RepID=A0A5S3XLK5_9GAMM|nr:tetratricopeptide repeat protein [Pseudoalteromonas citrea]TMP38301.1 tetratricopeptide repeat-containing protein [Pseudoalteromonas citrea]TMP55087.1 tetratricopeptide repeat-containing protein [Pseudoalteromonas citrea]
MKLFANVFLLVSIPLAAENIDNKLQEAKDYLTVDPAQSLQLLSTITEMKTLTVPQQITKHIITMRASVPTGKTTLLIDSIDAAFHHYQHPIFIENLTTITSALGIWLRKNNYLDDAQISFECSYRNAKNDRHKLILTNSLALLARQLDDLDKAKTLYTTAKKLARASQQKNVLAIIENNQGMIALEEGKVTLAEQHFRKALIGYQNLDKRSGQISAGLNLLFIFLIQEEQVNFERLYEPTYNLTNAFSNETKKALLFWLNMRFLQLQGKQITKSDYQQLKINYQKIKDKKLKALVNEHLAPKLLFIDIDIEKPTILKFNRDWFKYVKLCNW